MTFETPEMILPKRRKSIRSRKDERRSRVDLTIPLVCRDLQPTGLICHVEPVRVSMAVEENPAHLTNFPELPSTNPSGTSHLSTRYCRI